MPTGNVCRGLRRESGSKLPHSKKISSLAARLGRASLCARETRARTTRAVFRATNSRARGRADALAHAAADTAPKRFGEIAKRDKPYTVSCANCGPGFESAVIGVAVAQVRFVDLRIFLRFRRADGDRKGLRPEKRPELQRRSTRFGYTRIFAVSPAPPVDETNRMRRNLACTGPGTAALGIERASPVVAVEVSMV